MRVQDKLCSEWEARPNNQMYCNIPCRKDCVTSEWGEWSECPDICETGQDVTYRPSMRSRQKTILARAGLGMFQLTQDHVRLKDMAPKPQNLKNYSSLRNFLTVCEVINCTD